jgi:hypothetical protein
MTRLEWRFKLPANDMLNANQHIKWCRANMGDRGQGWDFEGSLSGPTITITDAKLATFYRLKFPQYDTLR